MGFFESLRKDLEFKPEKTEKTLKTLAVAGGFGALLVTQITALGMIGTVVANPFLRSVAQGFTIGGTTVASAALGYKSYFWVFKEDLKRQNEWMDQKVSEIVSELEALD